MSNDRKAPLEKAKIFSFIPTGEYYFNKGIKAYDRFDINKAKKYLKRAMELEPHEPLIMCQLALVYTEAGEYEESNKLLFTVLNTLDKRLTECHYFLANNFAHMGMFSEAYKHAHLYLELDEDGEFEAEAKELLDLIGFEQEDDLVEWAEQEDMMDQLDTARSLLESYQFEQAIEILEQIVAKNPQFWPALNNLALAYFYTGETKQASSILERVLENNPGNLHALCNLAVFLFYENDTEQLDALLAALDKVQPMLFEHRYKLGATFALTGKYEQAYYWLRQIQKYGFEGDAGYFYWLAKAAYFTGNEKAAYHAWEQLARLNPSQGSLEPWKISDREDDPNTLTKDDLKIIRLLRSDKLEERLFALFMFSVTKQKKKFISLPEFKQLEQFTLIEKIYLAFILGAEMKNDLDPEINITKSHEICSLLFGKYQENPQKMYDLLISWFSYFIQLIHSNQSITNIPGTAAAMEYIWLRDRNNKTTQKNIAKEYSISTATVGKYVRFLESFGTEQNNGRKC